MKYWMSLEQWKKDKTFQKLAGSEFVTPPFAPEDGAWDRREFLKLMGASLALSSLGCLRRPAEIIIPHLERPEDQVPGVSNYYASSYYDRGEAFGLMVQTREGRPIKVEGHPQHPINKGGMSVRAHSHLLALYDPGRLKTPRRNLFNKEKTNKESIRAFLDEADPSIVNKLKEGKTAILTDYFPSPASWEAMSDFSKAYSCFHFAWDPVDLTPHAQVYRECFGQALVPQYHLDKARVIVSVHCDFLGSFLSPTEHLRKFSLSRKPQKDMSRLIVFESLLSLTGTNADERFIIRPSEGVNVLWIMIDEILSLKNSSAYFDLRSRLKKLKPLKYEDQIRKIAGELFKYGKEAVVLAGDLSHQTKDHRSVLILMNLLNDLLQNSGTVIDEVNHYTAWSRPLPSIKTLIQQLNQKKIQNVIIHRTNPLYSYPHADQLSSALKKAEMVIYTGDRMDETAQVSDYIIPDHHDLEKWGEWEFQKGLHTIQQPTIRPLITSRDFEENLIVWARLGERGPRRLREASSWYHYLKASASERGLSWNTLLKKGFKKNILSVKRNRFNRDVLKTITKKEKEKKWELVLYTTAGLKDGRLANVSWLQEFPDPVTKICWDNYLCISPADARKLSLKEGQVVELTASNITQKVPVHIQPGQSSHTLGLALGYGRSGAGEVADHVGVNAYPFMNILKNQKVSASLPAQLEKTGRVIPLAVVQGHHSMEGRQIVVETTLKNYLRDKSSGIHRHKVFSLWSKHDYPREKWGMVIDLNSCTGCGACIVACQSENNIPVVGKKYVLEGREMHWLRVDRYYTGDPKKPKSVVHQPVVCMHCDNAPCETVCPVAATVHSDEGTNDMIYNRCVGTRYCSNNCPYKVRRFNWFDYAKRGFQTPAGALNPDVTVRSRGVMEKCTFCIHRIRSKQATARLKGKTLKDGDIQTACQQSCPAKAIVFGDLNNEKSKVRKAFEEENAYSLLEELNTRPAVKYRTKIRNNRKEHGHKDKGHA